MAQEDIDRIRAEVEKTKQVSESAIALIKGLAQQIRDAADDPDELRALARDLEANAAGLSTAIENYRPAGTTPATDPVPTDPIAPDSPAPETPGSVDDPGEPAVGEAEVVDVPAQTMDPAPRRFEGGRKPNRGN